jgi:hypothetical protein
MATTSPILQLPQEIKDLIWNLTIKPQEITYPGSRRKNPPRKARFLGSSSKNIARQITYTDLLSTCREMYFAFHPIICANTTAEAESIARLKTFVEENPHVANLIRSYYFVFHIPCNRTFSARIVRPQDRRGTNIIELKQDLAGVMGKISSSMLSLELEINLHVTETMTPQRTWIGDQTTIGVSELFRPLGGLRALERSKVDMTMTTSGTNAAHRWNFLYFSMLKSVLIFNVRNMMGRNDATRKKRI